MRSGFAFSIGVHALILLLILVGLPFLRVKPREMPPMISVELIDVGKQTTTNRVSPAEKIVKQPEPETPPPPPKPPQSAPEPQPPQPPQLADTPAPPLPPVDAAAPKLEPPQADIKPQLAPAPQLADVDDTAPKLTTPQANLKPQLAPAPELAQIDDRIAALVPPAKVELKRPPPKIQPKSFDAVLKNLTRTEPDETSPDMPQTEPKAAPRRAPSGAHAPLSAQLTASEMGALQQQLARCWNLPAAAKDAQNLVVDLDVTINPDRTIASAEVVDQGRMATDPTYAVAARAALRAIRMPECTPLELPPEKYQEWQSMNIHFDPKEMLGQ